MTPAEVNAVLHELSVLRERAEVAERRATQAETQRDSLRTLLTRIRTSLSEQFNDPGEAS